MIADFRSKPEIEKHPDKKSSIEWINFDVSNSDPTAKIKKLLKRSGVSTEDKEEHLEKFMEEIYEDFALGEKR